MCTDPSVTLTSGAVTAGPTAGFGFGVVCLTHLSFVGTKSFFFFQAEDGIRDGTVTEVQTCALPICYGPSCRSSSRPRPRWSPSPKSSRSRSLSRSEERRVGKECRSRWVPYHQKKKGKMQHTRSRQPYGRIGARERDPHRRVA